MIKIVEIKGVVVVITRREQQMSMRLHVPGCAFAAAELMNRFSRDVADEIFTDEKKLKDNLFKAEGHANMN